MKLKIVGCLCPVCGGEAKRKNTWRHEYDQWIGFIYECFCSGCDCDWCMLFTTEGRFCGIARESDVVQIGGYRSSWEFPPNLPFLRRDPDEIPF